jgi:16S rRNA (cytosine967-C5)-methyltransferase
VRLTRWAGYDGLTSLVNGVLRSILRSGLEVEFPDRERSADSYLAAFYSHPLWLVRRWLDRFGLDETEKLLEANNRRPALLVRTNTLQIEPHTMMKLLEDENVQCLQSPHCQKSIELRTGGDPAGLSFFEQGLFMVQDTSSTLVGMIPDIDDDTHVLDLCAAPGGKCTHVAERGNDKGLVMAVDLSVERMKMVLENRARLRLDSIICAVADGRNFQAGEFDLVLVDAPCTGTGVLSRRADLRWRLKEKDLDLLSGIQAALLENSSTLVKRGGNLLYSTCSLEPEENMRTVEGFLAAKSGYSLKSITGVEPEFIGDSGCFETFPHIHPMDGMFACLMARG